MIRLRKNDVRVLRKYLLPLLLIATIVIAYLFFRNPTVKVGDPVVQDTNEDQTQKVEAINQAEQISLRFRSYGAQLINTNQTLLELAAVKDTLELSAKSDSSSFLSSLSESSVSIKVPAYYRYHVNMNGPWKFTQNGSTLVIEAPALKPTLPVAFDSARIERTIDEGYVRFDSSDLAQKLESQITSTLESEAHTDEKYNLIRIIARVNLKSFFETWMAKDESLKGIQFDNIEIKFQDEITNSPYLRY